MVSIFKNNTIMFMQKKPARVDGARLFSGSGYAGLWPQQREREKQPPFSGR
jgi:hypothetical protein